MKSEFYCFLAFIFGVIGTISALRAVYLSKRNARLLRGFAGKDAEYRKAYEEIRG